MIIMYHIISGTLTTSRIRVSPLHDHPLPGLLIAIDCLNAANYSTLQDFVREAIVEIVGVWVPWIFLNEEVVGHLFVSLVFKVGIPVFINSKLLPIFLWPNAISIIIFRTYNPLLTEQAVVTFEAKALLFLIREVSILPAPYCHAQIGDFKVLSILGCPSYEVTRLSFAHLINYK